MTIALTFGFRLVDLIEMRFDHLAGGDFFRADGGEEIDGAHKTDVGSWVIGHGLRKGVVRKGGGHA